MDKSEQDVFLKGDSKIPGKDFQENHAPVVSDTTVEQSGLPSKKYLDQMIGLITTIITYSTTAVSLLQLRSKEPRTAGTIQTSRRYQTSYLEL
jgi:hypothetical protein